MKFHNIRYVLFCAVAFLWCRLAVAQSFDKKVSSATMSGISNIAESVISDSFVPMTGFSKGDYTVSFVPAVFDVSRVYDSPEVSSDDLRGYSAGAGFGYALSDRVIVYSIVSAMRTEGTLEEKIYSKVLPQKDVNTDYSMFSLCGGAGYDFLERNSWSLPVYAGIIVQKHKGEFSADNVTSGSDEYFLEGSFDNLVFGATVAAALSYRWNNGFSVTPYFLYMQALNEGEYDIKLKGTVSGVPFSSSETLTAERFSGGMPGLSVGYSFSKGFSMSLSLGGIITSSSSFYNDTFLNGLKMRSLVVAFSYRGSSE